MSDDTERSVASAGSQVVAYAVIDDEGVQHSLWFLEKDAMSEAAMVGGTVVRLGVPALTDAEQLAIAWAAREADEWDEEDTPEVAAHAEALRGLAKRLF
jgi:hypothetical protein